MNPENNFDVLVIGAGPAGLVLTRHLAKTKANFVVLEKNNDVGGIWDIDAPGSPMYDSAHFISSRTQSGFPGFPMPEDYPDYPSHAQILRYIRAFADEYKLRQHIRFNENVEHAFRDTNGLWQVQLSSGATLTCNYLICANGVTWIPNIVEWPGHFSGEIVHSVQYKNSDSLRGKRVLVVGGGNSGVDIACDASFASEQAFLSVRRGYHFLPKHIMGIPTDVFFAKYKSWPLRVQRALLSFLLRLMNGDLKQFGLPEPDHKLLESHPLMNTQILHYLAHGDCIAKPDIDRLEGDEVIFADGSKEKVDLIISATGYKHACIFLDDDVLEESNGRPDLYLRMFSRTYNNLAILGFIEFASAAYANFDAMAELIVADALAESGSEKKKFLDNLKKVDQRDLKAGHHYIKSDRHANYVDLPTFLKAIRKVQRQAVACKA